MGTCTKSNLPSNPLALSAAMAVSGMSDVSTFFSLTVVHPLRPPPLSAVTRAASRSAETTTAGF
eukprot:7618399-Pyramimonas_sp.AAC.1